jgi:IS5 family transposase
VKLVITPGQTHDIKAAAELLSDIRKGQMVLADRAYYADWLRTMVSAQGGWANIPPKTNRKRLSASRPGSTNSATSSSASLTNSNIIAGSQRVMTSSVQHTSPWSNSLASGYACDIMSPRPSIFG